MYAIWRSASPRTIRTSPTVWFRRGPDGSCGQDVDQALVRIAAAECLLAELTPDQQRDHGVIRGNPSRSMLAQDRKVCGHIEESDPRCLGIDPGLEPVAPTGFDHQFLGTGLGEQGVDLSGSDPNRSGELGGASAGAGFDGRD
jgi:hypothetical protein